ncbi:DNA-binding SARP family transcriptional activator/DNA-binding XRE family transcriptional regulator [Lipingzhangella halophila]|uniref:DNA-binding SARP family transcriptional activator/DNA-binding XRE family transcriptional regulator n=1 Tax=Lipingzhangella halophila TaxID=1783352 RepID=A0A7W7W640_9ACTN|nr:BTAD domain-containing putative transcriptional regulator [Lipingzhangella halophila]MBB4934485.1 DNA-binding SARP family transcriptional activator/DNA-binding XRE family transcriptional regulator [Lipingzhangella halophila]
MDASAGLASLVRVFRQRAGLTQHDLAGLAGLSVAALRDVEQGRVSRPRASTLRRLVEALDLARTEADELVRAGSRDAGGAPSVRVGVLGPLLVTVDGVPVDPGSEAQRTLLGLLTLSPNAVVGHDSLVEAAWGTRPPSSARGSLRSRMSRMRRRLRPARAEAGDSQVLAASAGGYYLMVTGDQLDLLEFRHVVARARQEREAGELTDACALFGQAAELWRGEPLADVAALRTHPGVVALSRERQAVVVEYADVAAGLGRHEEVLPHLRQVAGSDPLHEAAHAALMIALAGCGQHDAAGEVFHRLRRRLVEELGTDPGPELVGAYQRVLQHDIAREPVPVNARHQLPPGTTDFVGRSAELRTLHESLVRGTSSATAVPICAIQGTAGVGKTQLAIRFAHQLLGTGEYAEQQLWVDLRGRSEEPSADPAVVLASFLGMLGVPPDQVPAGVEERAVLFRDRLHGRKALVLLDNAESEEQIAPLLPASPTSLVLVTSRRALALDGAFTLALDVFSLAEGWELLAAMLGPERLAGAPAAAEWAVELCGRLPLAVAAAARHLQALPGRDVSELPGRLISARDQFGADIPLTRAVRTVFAQSYRALNADARRLFRLLALHPGPKFTVECAAVLADLSPAHVQPLLDQLVDEHLAVAVARNRYQLRGLLAAFSRCLTERVDSELTRNAAAARLRPAADPRRERSGAGRG